MIYIYFQKKIQILGMNASKLNLKKVIIDKDIFGSSQKEKE